MDDVTDWALRAQHGDPLAEAALVRATQAEVWRLGAALVDPGAADDLTQETYLRALRALPAFEARSGARTWLFGIARRTCADHLRTVSAGAASTTCCDAGRTPSALPTRPR